MKTAVEWFVEKLRTEHGLQIDLYDEFKQAKAMEKKQMSNAMLHGWRKALDEEVHSIDPNDFYNETFKSE